MRVSLVTTVLDEAGSARELISSIRRQTRFPDEWIVADGGSADATPEIFGEEPSCTVLRLDGNIAAGRNAAIGAASGDAVAVIDGGCAADPRWLERLVGVLESGAAEVVAGATTPRIRGPFDAAQWVLLDQFVVARPAVRAPAVSSRSIAFLRRAWEASRYPEWLDHSEDAWLVERWRRLGLRIVREPRAVVEWKLRDTLRGWARQHYLYARGQARGGVYGARHAARLALYAAVVGLVVAGLEAPALAAVGLGVWLAYAVGTLIRLPAATRGRGWWFRLETAALLPGMMAVMDAAKIAGALAGWAGRVSRR